MTITDGIDTFTYTGGRQIDDFQIMEQSTARTVGGNLRTVIAGRRYVETLKLRLKAADVQSLFRLLNKSQASFSYTPDVIPAYLTTADFPMVVSIDSPVKEGQAGGDGKTYYVTLTLTSVSYI